MSSKLCISINPLENSECFLEGFAGLSAVTIRGIIRIRNDFKEPKRYGRYLFAVGIRLRLDEIECSDARC